MASTVISRRFLFCSRTEPSRSTLPRCVELLVCLVLGSACEPTPPPAPAQAPVVTPLAPAAGALATATPPAPSDTLPSAPNTPARAPGPLSDEEIALFDRVVADEILFPRATERERYERLDPETSNDQHHVGFELKQQPGMKKGRHFHLIDVAVARAGTYVSRRRQTKLNGSAGPNGSSIEFAAQTKDGAYDIRVSQGMLLVRPVKPPQFDPERVALALVNRYDELRARARTTQTN
jgi:hypothetical protein